MGPLSLPSSSSQWLRFGRLAARHLNVFFELALSIRVRNSCELVATFCLRRCLLLHTRCERQINQTAAGHIEPSNRRDSAHTRSTPVNDIECSYPVSSVHPSSASRHSPAQLPSVQAGLNRARARFQPQLQTQTQVHSETAGREFLCALREEFCCSRQVQRIFAIPQLQLFAASQLTSALKCNKGKCNQLLSTTSTKRKLSTLLTHKEKKSKRNINYNMHKKPVKINRKFCCESS